MHNCSCWSVHIARSSRKRRNELFDATSSAPLCDAASSPPTGTSKIRETAVNNPRFRRRLYSGPCWSAKFSGKRVFVQSRRWRVLRRDEIFPSRLRSVTIPWAISPNGSIPVQHGKPCSSVAPSATRPLTIVAGSVWPWTADAGWRTGQGCALYRPPSTPGHRTRNPVEIQGSFADLSEIAVRGIGFPVNPSKNVTRALPVEPFDM
jgi:hypothetical protein